MEVGAEHARRASRDPHDGIDDELVDHERVPHGVDDELIDDELIDDERFVVVLHEVLPGAQRRALLLLGDRDAADDVVAEAVTRLLPRWRSGGVADPGAYLRQVIVNLCRRRWRRRRMSLGRDHAALDWVPPASDDDAVVADRDAVLRAVVRLPPRRRAVVVLRFYDDLSEAQIAEALGVRVGTVKSQLSRALEQLRSDLATLTDHE